MKFELDCWSTNPSMMPCDVKFTTVDNLEWWVLSSVVVLGLAFIYWWRPRG